MDVIARLPGCDRQAADAVSGYTQVRMDDAPKLLKIPKSECPDLWIRLPRHKRRQSWSNIEKLHVVFLERNLYGLPPAGLLWETQFEEKCRTGNVCRFIGNKDSSFSVYVDEKNDWTRAECGSYSEDMDETGRS